MSERIAAALCLAAFFATASPCPVENWMSTAWGALTAAAEEEPQEPETKPGGSEEGWLIDPNG